MSDKCSEKFYSVKDRLVFHRPQCRFISAYDPSRLTEVADYGSGINGYDALQLLPPAGQRRGCARYCRSRKRLQKARNDVLI